MLINGRKFDIRVWVLLNQDARVYFFREGYLRTSSETYSTGKDTLDNLYIHLTNNAVQKYNKSYSKHEAGNQLSFQHLRNLLTGLGISYDTVIGTLHRQLRQHKGHYQTYHAKCSQETEQT